MKRLLEIESKFHFSESLLPRFRANQGTPPFRHLAFLRTRKFVDTYFDRGGVLQSNGLWVRERGDVGGTSKTIEAKKRISGTYNRSTFDELTDLNAIRAQILHYLPPNTSNNSNININAPNFGLDILAQLTTTRQIYVADERFTLVLDQTDFGHSVGEVEVEVEVGDDAEKAEKAEQAHKDIDAFLAKYSWFCQPGPVEGKLSAYFRLNGVGTGGQSVKES